MLAIKEAGEDCDFEGLLKAVETSFDCFADLQRTMNLILNSKFNSVSKLFSTASQKLIFCLFK